MKNHWGLFHPAQAQPSQRPPPPDLTPSSPFTSTLTTLTEPPGSRMAPNMSPWLHLDQLAQSSFELLSQCKYDHFLSTALVSLQKSLMSFVRPALQCEASSCLEHAPPLLVLSGTWAASHLPGLFIPQVSVLQESLLWTLSQRRSLSLELRSSSYISFTRLPPAHFIFTSGSLSDVSLPHASGSPSDASAQHTGLGARYSLKNEWGTALAWVCLLPQPSCPSMA